ncbi:MAG: Xaa-Pro peptidase family protein [Thermomicrobiales bacterium]
MSGEHARQRMEAVLAESDVDAVIAISPENVFYLSRALILTQRYIPDRLAIVVWPRGGEPTFIVCAIEATLARQDTSIADLRTYVEFAESPVAVLAGVLAERGLARGRLGFEPTVWNVGNFRALTEALPGATLVPAEQLFDRARMVKGAWEIAHLSHAAHATDAAVYAAFRAGRPGWSEKAIGDRIQQGMLADGADFSPFLVLAAGENARRVHHFPNTDPMPEGSILHFDGGGFWQGYYSDMARTAAIGRASAEQRDIYARLWAVQQEIIAGVRAGVRACDLYAHGKWCYEQQGLPFGMTLIGHSLGVVLHEHPVINAATEEPLQPGMLLAIEPAVGTTGGVMYHIEDLVLVTDGEPQIVSRAGEWAELLEIGV